MSKYGHLLFHLREALTIIKSFKGETDDSVQKLMSLISSIKEEINIES